MAEHTVELPRRVTMLDALLYLMTKHAQSPCPILHRAIVMHLEMLSNYPAADSTPEHLVLLARLRTAWEGMAVLSRHERITRAPVASQLH